MTDRRYVLGITGAPGAGKSTLSSALVTGLGSAAALVPMDGFHRYQSDLEQLGRADRKGAPDTFDAESYVAVLERLRSADHVPVTLPDFDRDAEDPVPDAITVLPSHRILVTEGNYLLVSSGGWERVAPLLDACWFVDLDGEARVRRLIARHVAFGRSPVDAEDWVLRSDEANARLVETTRSRADRVVREDEPLDGLVAAVRAAAQTR